VSSSESQGKVFLYLHQIFWIIVINFGATTFVLCKSLTKQVFNCRALAYVCTTAVLYTMLQLRSRQHEGVQLVVMKAGGDIPTAEFSKKGSF
jgi:hypothetical protein